ncbi:MAG: DUF362 domain-containing protein [Clostridia bacterium]|nr:DUF362 domain-containing protein [Clostridia bacterium]
MSVVSAVPCDNYAFEKVQAALIEALTPLGGLEWVQPGMNIVIKANLVSMMKPESAATTHPSLLCALTNMLAEKGANVVIGDSPGGLYNSIYVNRVYQAAGIRDAEKYGAVLNQDFSTKHKSNPTALTLKEFEYTRYLDNADAIINFCKLKTHGMMAMSAAVKNMFGVIPGTFKPEYHYLYPEHARFADMLIDINECFRQRLCIMDAVVGMEGNGPTAGTPRKIGAVLASDSPYALDRIASKLIGLMETDVETISAAEKRGLNDEITLVGNIDPLIVHDFKLVRKRKDTQFYSDHSGIIAKLTGKVIKHALCSFPKAKKNECVGCAKCADICPAKAITMEKRRPVIDRKKCIRCFCCQEFCPPGAMKVKRPIIAKLFNR